MANGLESATWFLGVLAVGVITCIEGSAARGTLRTSLADLTSAQSDYVEQCGGCHSLEGDTSPAPVPVLRGRVGYFMSSPAGRRYLIRLPNIARSLEDNQRLADLMNFVVFGLGGASSSSCARAFTAEEVAGFRKNPLTNAQVFETRRVVVAALIRAGKAPASLRDPYLQADSPPL